MIGMTLKDAIELRGVSLGENYPPEDTLTTHKIEDIFNYLAYKNIRIISIHFIQIYEYI